MIISLRELEIWLINLKVKNYVFVKLNREMEIAFLEFFFSKKIFREYKLISIIK